jgi:uncharacterized membrane protein YdjX (TVP38/TMEM64 family)
VTRRQAIKGASLVAVLLGLFAASWVLPLAAWVRAFTDWVERQGPAGVVVFIGGYVVGTVALVPGSLLTIAAGGLFGVVLGALIALTGATIGATLSFLIARYLARGMVESWAANYRSFRALDAAIGNHDWKVIGLLRLSPAVPFNLSNYLFGVTRARLWAYVLASFIGMAPGAFLYAYLGHVGVATLAGRTADRTPVEIAFLVFGLVATAVVTWYLTRLARRELQREKGNLAGASG